MYATTSTIHSVRRAFRVPPDAHRALVAYRTLGLSWLRRPSLATYLGTQGVLAVIEADKAPVIHADMSADSDLADARRVERAIDFFAEDAARLFRHVPVEALDRADRSSGKADYVYSADTFVILDMQDEAPSGGWGRSLSLWHDGKPHPIETLRLPSQALMGDAADLPPRRNMREVSEIAAGFDPSFAEPGAAPVDVTDRRLPIAVPTGLVPVHQNLWCVFADGPGDVLHALFRDERTTPTAFMGHQRDRFLKLIRDAGSDPDSHFAEELKRWSLDRCSLLPTLEL